ncbi:MAG: sortase [Patescibacteria group bacterium]|nr:sortase [Patescibacteria group bacterium]
MSEYYYKSKNQIKIDSRKFLQFGSFLIAFFGFIAALYIFFPLISWQIYFAPVFASNELTAPIPKYTIVNKSTVQSLIAATTEKISGIDYTNAQNWFPNFKTEDKSPQIQSYTLSIPKVGIKDATVSTVDFDLSKHLINYSGTAIPPNKGNAVVVGHSTLPQLFNQNDYKTIFATTYLLKIGDEIKVKIDGIEYLYKVFNITVVDADDTSVFSQNYDDSYLTLITCTPPGTTWKRLIIKARFEKI